MKFFLILTLISGCVWLSSCSDDKDDDSGSSNGNNCKIESVVFESIYESGSVFTDYYNDFKFDQSGNVISYTFMSQDEDNLSIYDTIQGTYTYNTSSITVKDSKYSRIEATYVLEDGLITSAYDYWDNKFIYTYDSDKKLTKVQENNTLYECVWKDGNIISYTEKYGDNSSDYSISYVDGNNLIGFMPIDAMESYLDFYGGKIMFDPILCAEGYFGVMPKNLPSKISSEDSYESLSISYSDFNKQGYPSKMTVVESFQSQKYTYVWTMSWTN